MVFCIFMRMGIYIIFTHFQPAVLFDERYAVVFHSQPLCLSPLSSSATLVCRRWSQLIASFTHLQTKIRLHRKELHRDVENMDKPFLSQVFGANRKPLGDAKNRLLTKNGHVSTPSLPPHAAMAVPKRVMYKHRHCPQCKAPSKQLNHRRAECTNCRFDYCSLCLKTWHDSECERQRSPKRTSVENSAGSKRSKKNLRRL